MELIKILNSYKDNNYKLFQEKICQTKYRILGIKIPILRKITKEIIKNNNLEVLDYKDEYLEIVLIKGFIIANIDIDINKRIELINNYLDKIDNWLICDIFCSELKIVKNNLDIFLKYLDKIKNTEQEYYLRFYIVILLNYYLNKEYINYVLESMLNIKSDKYYVNMAISWCLTTSLSKDYKLTYQFLKKNKNKFSKFVLDKTVSKAYDSYKLTKEQKLAIKELKNFEFR